MLFKLKLVLYPPDATAINRRRYKITRFFLAVAYEHCITMKHFRFGDKTETSLNFFSLFFPSVWVFEICVWVSWKLRPRETNTEKRFKLVSILLSKMFYGHAMFIGGRSRYLSFPVCRCRVPWIQKLTSIWTCNIIATLSLISISSVTKIRRQMSWHVLKLDLNSAQWMPKLVSIDAQGYRALTSQSLRATIGPLQDNWPLFTTSSESQESYLTTGMLPYKHSSFFPPTRGSIMLW